MRDDKMPGRPSWSAGQMSMKSDVTGQIDSRFQLRHIARTLERRGRPNDT
jgi:hypothetical protein